MLGSQSGCLVFWLQVSLARIIKIGRDYACVLTRDGMAPLFRVVIAEAKQFPELSLFHY
uniref:TetR/AcrR family transcriptional regulator C-terminal domain-containing protein n=1 Tax=Paenibacillus sp. FSL H8-0079 TaxID=2921375 RepID=UPI00403F1F13